MSKLLAIFTLYWMTYPYICKGKIKPSLEPVKAGNSPVLKQPKMLFQAAIQCVFLAMAHEAATLQH